MKILIIIVIAVFSFLNAMTQKQFYEKEKRQIQSLQDSVRVYHQELLKEKSHK
jgi:nitrogen fixation-related uncharacterized protein